MSEVCELCGSGRKRNLVHHYKKAGIETSSFELFPERMFGYAGTRCIPCIIQGRSNQVPGLIRYASNKLLKSAVLEYRNNHSGVWRERWV